MNTMFLPVVHPDTAIVAECELIRGEAGGEGLGLLHDWIQHVRIQNPEVFKAVNWLAHDADEQARAHAFLAMGLTYQLLNAQKEVEMIRGMAAGRKHGDWRYAGLAVLAIAATLFVLAIFVWGGN
jgi:hypothetical protein